MIITAAYDDITSLYTMDILRSTLRSQDSNDDLSIPERRSQTELARGIAQLHDALNVPLPETPRPRGRSPTTRSSKQEGSNPARSPYSLNRIVLDHSNSSSNLSVRQKATEVTAQERTPSDDAQRQPSVNALPVPTPDTSVEELNKLGYQAIRSVYQRLVETLTTARLGRHREVLQIRLRTANTFTIMVNPSLRSRGQMS